MPGNDGDSGISFVNELMLKLAIAVPVGYDAASLDLR